jgi:hypothetical protein
MSLEGIGAEALIQLTGGKGNSTGSAVLIPDLPEPL